MAPLSDAIVETTTTSPFWSYGGGIIGFLIFLLDVIVIIEVLQSERELLSKLAWIALVLFFPVFGALIYVAIGHHHRPHGYQSVS